MDTQDDNSSSSDELDYYSPGGSDAKRQGGGAGRGSFKSQVLAKLGNLQNDMQSMSKYVSDLEEKQTQGLFYASSKGKKVTRGSRAGVTPATTQSITPASAKVQSASYASVTAQSATPALVMVQSATSASGMAQSTTPLPVRHKTPPLLLLRCQVLPAHLSRFKGHPRFSCGAKRTGPATTPQHSGRTNRVM